MSFRLRQDLQNYNDYEDYLKWLQKICDKMDMTIFTYAIEKRFLFWKYYTIKQVMPDVRKPVYDHEFPTAMKAKLTAQRDYQQMWEWLNEYKDRNNGKTNL